MVRLQLVAGLAVLSIGGMMPQARAESKSKDLRITMVDEDGGAAAIFLTPEGKSILIDAGWPPNHGAPRAPAGASAPATPAAPVSSSADRIAAAATALGIKKFDYLIMTHYHIDHLGGVQSLLEKIDVDTFIDHGPNREFITPETPERELAIAPEKFYPQWEAAIAGHKHITVSAGQTMQIGSLKVEFVTSDGAEISSALAGMPGAGAANPLCAGVPQMGPNGGEENVRSMGMLMTYGKTSILDLGDLTWNKELELLCPANKIGKVDLYFVTGHGMNISNSPPTAAFDPVVAVMQNGTGKGFDAGVMKTLRSFPDTQGLWLDHASTRFPDSNGDPNYIANVDAQPDKAYPIEVAITPAGKITLTNDRNQFSKTYTARAAQK